MRGIWKGFAAGLLSVMILSIPVFAAQLVPTLDEGTARSLTLRMHYADGEDEDLPIEGATLTIVQVASLSVQNGSAVYTPTEPFQNEIDISFDGMTASQSAAAAARLEEIVKQKRVTTTSAVTGATGTARFSIPNDGMYLIMQAGTEGDAKKYETISPFLIPVPMAELQNDEISWIYSVTAEPKTEIIKSTPEPPPEVPPTTATEHPVNPVQDKTNVKTGDETPLMEYVLVFGVSGGVLLLSILVIVLRRRADRKK